MSLPHPASAVSPYAVQHARIAEIDTAIITLVHQRMAALSELETHRRNGDAPRTELAQENAVFLRYEAELGRLGTRLAMLLTTTAAVKAAPGGSGTQRGG